MPAIVRSYRRLYATHRCIRRGCCTVQISISAAFRLSSSLMFMLQFDSLILSLKLRREIGARIGYDQRKVISFSFTLSPRLFLVFEFISPRLKNFHEYSFLHASIIPPFNLNPVRGHIVAATLITPYMDFIS